ncbi:hypothetical protein CDL15_Pgr001852 [Punica granatum]|uniref:non-specific serine/threonine protein kinase n=1 Tax=Punica granatum TaxID=22663 RepID=A0A218XBW5_PUNGR|nr:hypothetical protein CDL15_Pgr001852 [Punica granatum]PKI62038.1 hypothetical protein CRG98_017411 [Punica granatum]
MKKPLQLYPFFVFLCPVLSFLLLQADSAALPGDTQLLLSFKSAIKNPASLQNWVSTQSPCSFSGVTCISLRVTSIDLSSSDLSADFHSVAAFLLPLDSLETLTLRATNLTGTISPPAGAKCGASLSSLDLSLNSLSGPFSSISNLASCSSLKRLNLSGNSLDSSVEDKAGLKLSLQAFDLSFNKISGPSLVPWVAATGCIEMTILSLKGNRATGEVDVSKCGKLAYLDISSNNFSATLPKLSDCSALEHLDLSSNRFYGEVGGSLSRCSQLSFLNLSTNHFSGSIPSLPTKNLQFLHLSSNDFQGAIPSSLSDACSTLLELDLSHNNLSGSIPSSLDSCSLLQSLDISNNNFSGHIPMNVLFSGMTGLKKLVLSFNYFSGPLPDSVSKLPDLETLDLSSNSLSGSIPGGLCQNPSTRLQVLYLQNNLFAGLIPQSLSNCSQLVSLDLSFNYLSGSIPSSLGSLPKLKDLILLLNQLEGEIPTELMYIKTLENLILDFNYLTGNIPAGLSNCTDLNWISLSNNRLSGPIPGWIGQLSNLAILKLSNNSFSGSIPPELGDARSLIWLDLNTNLLNGTIPPQLFKQSGKITVKLLNDKRYAYIKNDGKKECHGAGNLLEFAGIRPEQLNRMSTRNPCNFTRVYKGVIDPTFKNNGSIIFLDISHNLLSGSIPKEIGSMYYLYVLNLGHNNISGLIPPQIGQLRNLNILDLSSNHLEGTIPQALVGCSMLTEINLSNNFLTGLIPEMGQLGTFPTSSFLNNTGLCGIPLAACGADSGANAGSQHQKSNRRRASLVSSVAMGLLFSLFCIFGLIFVAMETRKRRKKKDANSSSFDVYVDSLSHSGAMNWKLTSAQEALSINLSAFEKPLRMLTFGDLLEATNGFHNDSLIGSGGFGDVYKAQLKDGSVVAIKKLIHVSGQGDREFMAEMETIGKIKHRNLVSLLGYCKVKEERLLVYEYMKYGSLEDVLHDHKKAGGVKLDWAARRMIAIGAARGLAFLHHNCIPHIIHRDMKSSNVLLDENLEARVSDFGMARLMSAMDTHLSVSTLAGTPGYVPPEYYQSFRCSTKGDVYSYGVVLLELLTGKRPTDSADFGDNNLVGWVKQHAKLKISDVFDPVLLKEDPGLEIELLQHLRVACICLDDRPFKRPTMIQVLAMFREIQAGSGFDSVSTIATEDGGFGSIEVVDMSIKEVPEFKEVSDFGKR